MANNKDIVPYHDPFDSLLHDIFNFGNDPNPTLADISQFGGPSTNSSSRPQQNNGNGNANGILDDHDPFWDPDPMIQDMGNFSINKVGNFEAGPSELHGKNSHPNPNGQGNSSGPMPLSFWPEPPIPFFCSCCFVLREIIHTNGVNIIKLEIHGRLGIICHAIQLRSTNVGSSDSNHQFQMFDFCKRSIEEIKVFLTKYCLQQNSSGYILMQDPLSTYYEALCVGLDWTDLNDDLHYNSGAQSDDMEQGGEAEAEDGMERLPRTSLAAQRERAGKMKLRDFSDYFHLPIEEAAKHVNLCPTVVKKICRKEGLGRWPHRKVKSIARQISILRKSLEIEDAASRAGTQAEIDRLQQEMIQHCGGVLPTSINFE